MREVDPVAAPVKSNEVVYESEAAAIAAFKAMLQDKVGAFLYFFLSLFFPLNFLHFSLVFQYYIAQ